MAQQTLKPGTKIKWHTSDARRQGVVLVAPAGGFLLAALGLVRTERVDREQFDRVEPIERVPYVVPEAEVEVIA